MYRAGLRSILSQLARDDRIAVVESFNLEAPKTRLAAQKLKGMGLDSVLIVTDDFDENVYLATRNLANVAVVEPRDVDPLSLIHYEKGSTSRGSTTATLDRKSTRLNSSHVAISYAVFCLKKKER